MVRTIGARDTQKRKRRKDKGKGRKFYAGKSVKRKRKNKFGNLIPYESKRKRDSPILIWFWEVKPMSYEGYKRWNRKLRPRIRKTVFYPIDKPFYINPESISTKEKLGLVAIETIQYPGSFQLRMPSHSKNSFRVSFRKKAEIKILEDANGDLYSKVFNTFKLSRYWYWRG
jgi:hypothetical protein